MKDKKEIMNKIIEQTEAQTFTLFYKLMRGNFKFKKLTNEEKIISKCVKNECTDVQGACYDHYEEIKITKNIEKILYLQECILKVMCKKMFSHALKLGLVLQNNLELNSYNLNYKSGVNSNHI